MRKLATIRRIAAIDPIPGADAIEVATVDGWKVVVKKGEFKPGDEAYYFEIDSFLPTGNPAWQFLVDKQGRTFEGVTGHRLRTVKLRGQVSQGFIVPLSALPDLTAKVVGLPNVNGRSIAEAANEDLDMAAELGVVKWEQPMPAELAGLVEGYFPSFIPRTDQERCQNLISEIFEQNADARWEVSMKLDGTSCTIYHNNGKFGVCSRNLELKICDENKNNSLIRIARDSLVDLPRMGNFAVQGELMGPGIQGNREALTKINFYVFDVYDIDSQRYLLPNERAEFVDRLMRYSWGGGIVHHVPTLANDHSWQNHRESGMFTLSELNIQTCDQLLNFADGASLHHPVREGLVFKCATKEFSFKVISNKFLLKGGE